LIADGDRRGADSQFAEQVRFRASAGKQNGALEFDVRIVVDMIARLLADKIEFENGRPKPTYKHKLLAMIDEFPALGKLEILQQSLAFVAGYGIKCHLISQILISSRDGKLVTARTKRLYARAPLPQSAAKDQRSPGCDGQPAIAEECRKPACRLIISAPGVPVSDVGREEFPETFLGLRLRQEQRRRRGGDARQIPGSFERNNIKRFRVFHR
jgi:hypothetical protein